MSQYWLRKFLPSSLSLFSCPSHFHQVPELFIFELWNFCKYFAIKQRREKSFLNLLTLSYDLLLCRCEWTPAWIVDKNCYNNHFQYWLSPYSSRPPRKRLFAFCFLSRGVNEFLSIVWLLRWCIDLMRYFCDLFQLKCFYATLLVSNSMHMSLSQLISIKLCSP